VSIIVIHSGTISIQHTAYSIQHLCCRYRRCFHAYYEYTPDDAYDECTYEPTDAYYDDTYCSIYMMSHSPTVCYPFYLLLLCHMPYAILLSFNLLLHTPIYISVF
jgi:hypothetical protein